MRKSKETQLTNTQRNFVLQAVDEHQRPDGRKFDEMRKLNIELGMNWGSAMVSLGQTKVLAQVSCELGLPKPTRPHEGMMYVNMQLGPMAAPYFEQNRQTDLCIAVQRMLERTFKESRCVDLEQLCVTSEERVWLLRVDINVLNHEGNLIDCCAIAMLTALWHFKRPDVSIEEDGMVHIHDESEREMLSLTLQHYPLCISYCSFSDGASVVVDPTALEERVAESQIVFGFNSYQEICCLDICGTALTTLQQIMQLSKRAVKQTKILVNRVKKAIQDDQAAREAGQVISFANAVHSAEQLQNKLMQELSKLNLIKNLQDEGDLADTDNEEQAENADSDEHVDASDEEAESEEAEAMQTSDVEANVKVKQNQQPKMFRLGPNTVAQNSRNSNIKWLPESYQFGEINMQPNNAEKLKGQKKQNYKDASSDSEEDLKVIL